MLFFSLVPLFVLGAVVASFIGVLVARLNTGQSSLTGRSRCDACNATLQPSALIPIASYFLGRGRARCCGAAISPYAPLTEFLLGGLFVLAYLASGLTSALPLMLVSLTLLLALVLYDLAHHILPPSLLYAFVGVAMATGFLFASSSTVWWNTLITALLIATFLALIHFFSRGRAMGFADAPLAFGLSLLAGPAALSGLLFSFWIGAVIGIVLLARRPRGSRMGVEVPFAPFLASGFLLAYFTQWNLLTLTAVLP